MLKISDKLYISMEYLDMLPCKWNVNYGVYKQARNASWNCLLDCNIRSLPVKPVPIVRSYAINCKYQSAELLKGRSGMIYHQNDRIIILINQEEIQGRQRFTIMHELGHFLLGHLGETPFSRSEDDCRPAEEQAADKFAIDILAPACVLWGLQLHTPEEIADFCKISLDAARYRADRMKILYERNMFLTHPLERRVYAQFLQYIRETRKTLRFRGD